MASGARPWFSDECEPMTGPGVHVVDGSACLDGSLVQPHYNSAGCIGAISDSALFTWLGIAVGYIVFAIACCCVAICCARRTSLYQAKKAKAEAPPKLSQHV